VVERREVWDAVGAAMTAISSSQHVSSSSSGSSGCGMSGRSRGNRRPSLAPLSKAPAWRPPVPGRTSSASSPS